MQPAQALAKALYMNPPLRHLLLRATSKGEAHTYNREIRSDFLSSIVSPSSEVGDIAAVTPFAMEMKKFACAVLVAAASATAAMASDAGSPAPAPTSGSFAVSAITGSLVGASVFSFLAFYLQ
ncbi:hypothetical protein Taro_045082 [Colocasia esculenta]|uniref:Uncharacterized protein n=1 Tax=Colocasia esculenta TaxID=4460 RepID=A0A843WVP2_COLES|nr:hypothetical protein [Colocasia esculenta]